MVIQEFRTWSPVTTTTEAARRTPALISDASLVPLPSTFRIRGAVMLASATGSGSTTTIAPRHQPGSSSAAMSTEARRFAPKMTTRGQLM